MIPVITTIGTPIPSTGLIHWRSDSPEANHTTISESLYQRVSTSSTEMKAVSEIITGM